MHRLPVLPIPLLDSKPSTQNPKPHTITKTSSLGKAGALRPDRQDLKGARVLFGPDASDLRLLHRHFEEVSSRRDIRRTKDKDSTSPGRCKCAMLAAPLIRGKWESACPVLQASAAAGSMDATSSYYRGLNNYQYHFGGSLNNYSTIYPKTIY